MSSVPEGESAPSAIATDKNSDEVSEYSDAESLHEKSKSHSKEVNEEDEYHKYEDEEDDDGERPIKLFVGQVPKSMEEADLFPIFAKYGPMEDVAVIRDKHTGQHRGCAFITYLNKESADLCEQELHGSFPFEGGKRPVQVRIAGKKDGENKVFVGMLPRDVTEEMVLEVFSHFGQITGVFVLKSSDGFRKGCAFVKFMNKNDAIRAIKELNNQIVFPGSERSLIVKFADSKPERKNHPRSRPPHHPLPLGSGHIHGSGEFAINAINPAAFHRQTSLNGTIYTPTADSTPTDSPQMNGLQGPPMYPGHLNMPPATPPHLYNGHVPPHGPPPTQMDHHNTEYMYHHPPPQGMPQYSMEHPYPISQQMTPPRHAYDHRLQAVPGSNMRPREGPAGANLFIYHLPHDLTDADLATAFNPFGNVISAKVYVDKYTGESKGFGFVSYDSVIAAEQAIELMNGFQIGNKRLKVQHKRVHHRQPQASAMMPGGGLVGQGPPIIGGMPNSIPPPSPPSYHYGMPPAMGAQGMTPEMVQNYVNGIRPEPDSAQNINNHNVASIPEQLNSGEVPVPSIEISSTKDSVDSVALARSMSNIDAIAKSFSGLNTDDRDGN